MDEEQYIVVKDPDNDELVELPAEIDNNKLALATLEHAFPGAHGLKYKNPDTGITRTLSLDQSQQNFLPPRGGWMGKQFSIIFKTVRPINDASPEIVARNSNLCAPPPGFEFEPNAEFTSPPGYGHASLNGTALFTNLNGISQNNHVPSKSFDSRLNKLPKFNDNSCSTSTMKHEFIDISVDEEEFEPEFNIDGSRIENTDFTSDTIGQNKSDSNENIQPFTLSNGSVRDYPRIKELRSSRINRFLKLLQSQQVPDFELPTRYQKFSDILYAIQQLNSIYPDGCTPREFVEFENNLKIKKNCNINVNNHTPPLASMLEIGMLHVSINNRICVDSRYLNIQMLTLPKNLCSNFYRFLKSQPKHSIKVVDAVPHLSKMIPDRINYRPNIECLLSLCNRYPLVFDLESTEQEKYFFESSTIKLNDMTMNSSFSAWRIILDCDQCDNFYLCDCTKCKNLASTT